jgi:hypothetical protein
MPRYNAPFEIHVHGEVPLRADVGFDQLQEALKPLWTYAGAKSLADGAASAYEEEPGIRHDTNDHVLQVCWTIKGEDDFRQVLDEVCMGLNDLTRAGAALEVTFYDAEFDDIFVKKIPVTDPTIYSIQQSKLRTEEDHRLNLADKKKERER